MVSGPAHAGDRCPTDLQVQLLASGSRGNAAVVVAGDTCWLIDTGVSCRRLLIWLAEIGITPLHLNGVIITHEHSDHTQGLGRWLEHYPGPILTTEGTARALRQRKTDVSSRLVRLIPGATLTRDGVRLLPIRTDHDAAEPIGLQLCSPAGANLVWLTDTGRVTAEAEARLVTADILCLEANHDEAMLGRCRYPDWLKRRIRGNQGHLSNRQAAQALQRLGPGRRHVVLAHLSEEANRPEQVSATVGALDPGTCCWLASQDSPTPWIGVPGGPAGSPVIAGGGCRSRS